MSINQCIEIGILSKLVRYAGLISESDEEEAPPADTDGADAAAEAEPDEAAEEEEAPAAGPSASSHRGRLKRHRNAGELCSMHTHADDRQRLSIPSVLVALRLTVLCLHAGMHFFYMPSICAEVKSMNE